MRICSICRTASPAQPLMWDLWLDTVISVTNSNAKRANYPKVLIVCLGEINISLNCAQLSYFVRVSVSTVLFFFCIILNESNVS